MAVMRVRMRTTEKKRMFDFAAFREPAFSLFAFGTGVAFMGVYIPFFYISDFAISNGSASTTIAFYLLIILNGTSTFGRVLPNYVADKIGPLNVITPCAAVTAILAWCWIATSSKGGIIAFCVFYGFFSGSSKQTDSQIPVVAETYLLTVLINISGFHSSNGNRFTDANT